MATQGTTTIDFGSTPVDEATFTVNDATLSGLTYAEAFFMSSDATADNDAAAHLTAAGITRVTCAAPVGSSLSIDVQVLIGFLVGTYKLRYVAN